MSQRSVAERANEERSNKVRRWKTPNSAATGSYCGSSWPQRHDRSCLRKQDPSAAAND